MKPFDLGNCEYFVSSMLKKKRPFIDKQYPTGSDTDPFEAKRICRELKARMNKMRYIERNLLIDGQIFDQSAYPDQRATSLCGPAAFWYCVLKDNPGLYQKNALELWMYGKTRLGRLHISPGKHNRHPKNIYKQNAISGLDWMMLGGLRDSENLFFQPYDGGKAGGIIEGFAGLTQPGTLESWFEKAGSKIIYSNYAMYGLDFNHPDLEVINKFNQYAGDSNYHVVTVIGSGMLDTGQNIQAEFLDETGKTRLPPAKKDHWIVWESPVRVTGGKNTNVQLKAFSWGKVKDNYLRNDITLKKFVSYIFGGFIATKIT